MIRRAIGWLVAVAYALTGARCRVVRRLKAGAKLPVVIHALSAWQLDRMFVWLKRHGVLDSIWLTFDDGWATLKESLPILEKHNVHAKVFIAPSQTLRGNVWTEEANQLGVPAATWRSWYTLSESERNLKLSTCSTCSTRLKTLLSKDEVIELSKHPLISIENHTYSHLSAPHRPVEEVLAEVALAQTTLTEWTGREPQWLAWPFGRGSEELDDGVVALGLKTVYTRQGYEIGFCRNMALEDVSFQENLGRILGAWPNVGETL